MKYFSILILSVMVSACGMQDVEKLATKDDSAIIAYVPNLSIKLEYEYGSIFSDKKKIKKRQGIFRQPAKFKSIVNPKQYFEIGGEEFSKDRKWSFAKVPSGEYVFSYAPRHITQISSLFYTGTECGSITLKVAPATVNIIGVLDGFAIGKNFQGTMLAPQFTTNEIELDKKEVLYLTNKKYKTNYSINDVVVNLPSPKSQSEFDMCKTKSEEFLSK